MILTILLFNIEILHDGEPASAGDY